MVILSLLDPKQIITCHNKPRNLTLKCSYHIYCQNKLCSQQAPNIWITFVHCWADVVQMLYTCLSLQGFHLTFVICILQMYTSHVYYTCNCTCIHEHVGLYIIMINYSQAKYIISNIRMCLCLCFYRVMYILRAY